MERKDPKLKTISELWEENGGRSGFWIKSPTNKTKFKLVQTCLSKNVAIVYSRGKGIKFLKKYYNLYVLDNPRWERL